MKIESYKIYKVSIPTRRRHTWASSTADVGQGWVILEVKTDDGIVGYGEATTMPEWGGDFGRYYGESYETTEVVIRDNLVPAIMGMAAALEDACAHIDENAKKVSALRDRLIDGLSKIPHSALNGDPVNRLPGNVSFCFEGVEGESLLLLLDAKGICASSGSACTSGSLDPSHVLLAIGRPHDVARGSLRLSLCEWNTDEEVDRILKAVPEVVEYLRGMSPLWNDLVSGKKQFTL